MNGRGSGEGAALEAGRDLDALVAEHVLGEPRPLPTLGYDEFMRNLTGDYRPLSPSKAWIAVWVYNNGDVQEWVPRPFSTEIEAAWDVVKALRSSQAQAVLLPLKRLNR